MRLDRSEPGEGAVLYFGDQKGSRFIGVGLGFSGWESTPRGWWRFMHPYIHFGRPYSDGKGSRIYSALMPHPEDQLEPAEEPTK